MVRSQAASQELSRGLIVGYRDGGSVRMGRGWHRWGAEEGHPRLPLEPALARIQRKKRR